MRRDYQYTSNVLMVNDKSIDFLFSIKRVYAFKNTLVVQIRAANVKEFEEGKREYEEMSGGLIYGVNYLAEILWQIPYKKANNVEIRTDDWFKKEYSNNDVIEVNDGSMMRYHIEVDTGKTLAEIHGKL